MLAPNCTRRYLKVANAVLPALMAVPIRLEAKLILCEVLAQVWGRAKADAAVLDLPAITARWGLDRGNLGRGLKQLKDAGILRATDHPHDVVFDKAALVAILPPNVAKALEDFADVAAKDTHERGGRVCPSGHSRYVPADKAAMSNRTSELCPDGQANHVQSDKIQAPSYKEEDNEDLKTSSSSDDDASIEPFESPAIPFQAPPVAPGIQNDPAEVQRIVALAETVASMSGLDNAVIRWAKSYPVAWIERAVQQSAGANSPVKYGLSLLVNWKENNGPPKPKPDPNAPRTVRYVPFTEDDDDEPPVRIKGVDPNKVRAGNLSRCLPIVSRTGTL